MNIEVPEIIKKRYNSSFEAHLGANFHKYENGVCEISLKIENKHLNIGGTAHGGVINALCDIALSGAVTCNFTDQAGSVVTLDMTVNFLRPGIVGDTLFAYGEVVKAGKTINYVEGGVKNQDGKLIARASGNWFVKRS